MGYLSLNLISLPRPIYINNPTISRFKSPHLNQALVFSCLNEVRDSGIALKEIDKSKFKWVRTNPSLTEEHKLAISQLPSKMTNRCKALMKQIICFSADNGGVELMLAAWVKSTKPRRADWLSILRELDRSNHPLFFEVAQHALTEESFEPNIRDYTKIIHGYAKQNMLEKAEQTLQTMKTRGFICDQVTLTALIHMYSKANNLKLAENAFEEIKSLGVQLDKKSYGAMIMAYIRAGMLPHGENLLIEMHNQEIYAGREVYKALLRAYSMTHDSQLAQWVFDMIQLAGIIPDVKICGLLINAYVGSGRAREAVIAFENLRKAGIEPNDKCVALALWAYEKDNRMKEALDLLIELERDGIEVGKEASGLLVKWFRKLGVVDEVESVLSDFGLKVPML